MMKRTNFRLVLAVALSVGWIIVIWGNSLLPGQESSQFSGWVAQFLESLLPFLKIGTGDGMLLLRKLGHFSEFLALSLCLVWLFGMLQKVPLLPLLCGVAVACVDETIQRFIPGRNGCLTDVLIDSAGVLTGFLILTLVCRLRNRYKKDEML